MGKNVKEDQIRKGFFNLYYGQKEVSFISNLIYKALEHNNKRKDLGI